jgi:auxin efflux carrier family protein
MFRISIGVIYLIQSRTDWLAGDPILPFVMMLMPCGPSAMNLTSLTDVAGSPEAEKLSLAKFLTISYALSPLLSFAVVGSLKATQASLG